jgi:hypothetical protein
MHRAALPLTVALLAGAGAAAAAEADWSVEPLMEGRYRPEHYTLLRVTGPAATTADDPAMRIVVRPVIDSDRSVEFSARAEPARGKVTAIVPTVLYSPAVSRVHVSTRDERDKVLSEAVVDVGRPGLRAVPASDKLAVAVTANPPAVVEAMRAVGKSAGLRLEIVALKPEELPANHAGLDGADVVIVDLAFYRNLDNRRQELLRSWCLAHRNEAVGAAFGGPLLLFDSTGSAGGSLDRTVWKAVVGAGPAAFWAMIAVFDTGTLPMDLHQEAERRVLLEPTAASRPRLSDTERRMLAAGGIALGIAAAAIGLFTARAGRGVFGAVLLAGVSCVFAAVFAWVLPSRAAARLDVLEIVELVPPARPERAACAVRQLRYVGVAGLRETEAVFTTTRTEALLPVFPDRRFQGRIPVRVETRSDGRQDVTVRCRSTAGSALVADSRGGMRPTWSRTMPLYGLVGVEHGFENLPMELMPAGDGRGVIIRVGAGWSRRLTDCMIIDIPGPASLAGRVGGRERQVFPEARVISIGNFERGPNPDLPVALSGDKAERFADVVRIEPGLDELTRIRRAALRAAAGDDHGRCRLTEPYLVGWSDRPSNAVVGTLPDKLASTELGELVFIRLNGLFKAPMPSRP